MNEKMIKIMKTINKKRDTNKKSRDKKNFFFLLSCWKQ